MLYDTFVHLLPEIWKEFCSEKTIFPSLKFYFNAYDRNPKICINDGN